MPGPAAAFACATFGASVAAGALGCVGRRGSLARALLGRRDRLLMVGLGTRARHLVPQAPTLANPLARASNHAIEKQQRIEQVAEALEQRRRVEQCRIKGEERGRENHELPRNPDHPEHQVRHADEQAHAYPPTPDHPACGRNDCNGDDIDERIDPLGHAKDAHEPNRRFHDEQARERNKPAVHARPQDLEPEQGREASLIIALLTG